MRLCSFLPAITQFFYDGGDGGGGSSYPDVTDAYGQVWHWEVVGSAHGDSVYGWVQTGSANINGSAFHLPNTAAFPNGMIISLNGVLYQVTSSGTTWTTSITYTNPTNYLTIVSNTPSNNLFPATTGFAGLSEILLNQNPWPVVTSPVSGVWESTFTQYGATLQDVEYWTTTVAVPSSPNPACYTLNLNSVAGIMPGDKLAVLNAGTSGGSWTVAGVDPTLFQVSTIESVSNVPAGTQIYYDDDSEEEMVLQDPGIILTQAAYPYNVDLSKFQNSQTQDPVFGMIGSPTLSTSLSSTAIFGIGDIEPTLSGLKLSAGGYWLDPNSPGNYLKTLTLSGTPGNWTYTSTTPSVYTPNADWTTQLTSAPSSLMPYEPMAYNAFMRLRNRVYNDNTYYQENNGLIEVNSKWVNGSYVQTLSSGVYQYVQTGLTYSTSNGDSFTPWSPSWATLAGVLPIYDYTQMRRVKFAGSAVAVTPWTGTAWGSTSNYTWPGNSYIQSAVPMIGGPAGSILAVTSVQNLELWGLSGGLLNTTTCAVPQSLIGGVLQTTPYGTYLVGQTAIGLVTFSSNTLHVTVQYLAGSITYLWANTLIARTPTEFCIFGRYDDYSSGNLVTETWLFRINSSFVLGAGLNTNVIWSEMIQDGCPTVMGVTRDPSKSGRLVGHISGSLFQIDTQVPMTLQRFKPGGMTAMELIEHICQLYNALAIPDANGTLHIVSRVQTDSPIALTVDQVTIDTTMSWPDFASIVRISSQDGNYYSDSYGQQGGALLEVSDHPLCYTMSNCMAMAQGLISWFGQPRQLTQQTWFWTNPNTPAPWEGLNLWTKVTVNGGPNVRIVQMTQNYIEGTATVMTVGV
jgi:hypothetical protein